MGGSVKTIKRQHLRVYLSHCSVAVKRHYSNPSKKAFDGRFAYSFRDSVCHHRGREHGRHARGRHGAGDIPESSAS